QSCACRQHLMKLSCKTRRGSDDQLVHRGVLFGTYDVRSSLAGDEGSGSIIPRLQSFLIKGVQTSARDPAQRDSRRARASNVTYARKECAENLCLPRAVT